MSRKKKPVDPVDRPAVTYNYGRCFVYSLAPITCPECGLDLPANVAHCCQRHPKER
jgi:hypothetical protein